MFVFSKSDNSNNKLFRIHHLTSKKQLVSYNKNDEILYLFPEECENDGFDGFCDIVFKNMNYNPNWVLEMGNLTGKNN